MENTILWQAHTMNSHDQIPGTELNQNENIDTHYNW